MHGYGGEWRVRGRAEGRGGWKVSGWEGRGGGRVEGTTGTGEGGGGGWAGGQNNGKIDPSVYKLQ